MGNPPPRLAAFLEAAPPGSINALLALAAPESLSDWLAEQLIALSDFKVVEPTKLLEALHFAGFVIERNSEWHFSESERAFLTEELLNTPRLFASCHHFLFNLASKAEAQRIDAEIPAYLQSPVGRAYHCSAIDPAKGLLLYRETYAAAPGEHWLAARLASEQQRMAVLPPRSIEPAFLSGMVLYKEGKHVQALKILRPLAFANFDRYEVGVAAHLVGRSLKRRDPRTADRLLRRSLNVRVRIGDFFGEAQTLHTLAQFVWDRRPRQAEAYLRRSLDLLTELGDVHGQAEVMHSLGQKLWQTRPEEAENLLRQSIAMLSDLGDAHGQAQVLHSLGQKLIALRPQEAEPLLNQSLSLLLKTGDRLGQAQVLHDIARIAATRDVDEANNLLQSSLSIGVDAGDLRTQAIVSLSLGKLWAAHNPQMASDFILRSISINKKLGSRYGVRLGARELKKLRSGPSAG